MEDTGVVIRPAVRADVAELSALLGRAFEDDPPFVWALPDPATRRRRIRRYFTTLLRHEVLGIGAVDAAHDGDQVVGTALWLPPGRWTSPTGRQLLALPGFAWAFGRRLGHGTALVRACAQDHPREPHWYLSVLGVDPADQGRGVGGALLRHRLAQCDRDRMPAYLESSKTGNVPLYEHFGFGATGVLTLPEGAPVITTMWRPGRPAGRG